jgi:hypothetical protein
MKFIILMSIFSVSSLAMAEANFTGRNQPLSNNKYYASSVYSNWPEQKRLYSFCDVGDVVVAGNCSNMPNAMIAVGKNDLDQTVVAVGYDPSQATKVISSKAAKTLNQEAWACGVSSNGEIKAIQVIAVCQKR